MAMMDQCPEKPYW